MPWPQDAYVGQKVVCIDASQQGVNGVTSHIISNGVYSIREIGLTHMDKCGFKLNEIILSTRPGWISQKTLASVKDGFWCASRFRPLQSTSSSYSLLARLQDPTNHRNLDLLMPDERVPEEVQ